MDNKKYFYTKEQFDALYEMKIHIITVREQNCLKHCPRWLLDQAADVWESRTGEKVQRNWSCNSCAFNFINMIGKPYLQDLKLYEKEEKEQKEEPVEVFTNSVEFTILEHEEKNEQEEKPIKRKGRPKKQTE